MKWFTLLLVCISKQLSAQYLPVPTPFDAFINKPSVEWAARANDTFRFEKSGLNQVLCSRYAKNEIKAALAVSNNITEAGSIQYLPKDKLDKKVSGPGLVLPVFDSLGNIIRTDTKFRTIEGDSLKITGVNQILYIENGVLKSYIPWVAPKMPVATSTGIFLGYGDYFCSAFQFNYLTKQDPKNKILFLSETKRLLRIDSVFAENKLKELYGRNLVQTIWPYVLKNNFKLFDVEHDRQIKPADISTDLTNTEKIILPVYDSLGNVVKDIIYKEPLDPAIFSHVELSQKWYYNYTQNMVFNKIISMVLFAKKWPPNGGAAETTPILKIVFN